MALDYHKCAQEIVDNIGGRDNIAQAAHCATRLRLVIKDNSKVNDKALENIDGVKGKFESNGQLQLIIGNLREDGTTHFASLAADGTIYSIAHDSVENLLSVAETFTAAEESE